MRTGVVLLVIVALATGCMHPAAAFVPVTTGVAPERMRATLRDAYRIRPDQRFAEALAALPAILSATKGAKPAVRKETAGWAVFAGERRAELIGDEAGFEAWWQALVRQARALAPQTDLRRAAAPAYCRPFPAPGAWRALEKADADWSRERRDLAALATAARCLVALSLQHLDAVEVGDALPARALAALAAYHALSGEDVTRDLALMAEAMGYGATARKLAARLPQADPVRRFLLGPLPTPAPENDATAYLDRLARARSGLAEPGGTAPMPALPLLRVRFTGDERAQLAASRDIPYEVLHALWDHGGTPGETLAASNAAQAPGTSLLWHAARSLPRVLRISEEELLGVFEHLLARRVRARAGPLADEAVLSAWYRGFFYSALFTVAKYHLGQLSPAQPADEFAARLGGPRSPVADDFKEWYGAMAASRLAKAEPEELTLSYFRIRTLGWRPMIAMFHEYRSRELHAVDTTAMAAGRKLFLELDDRPSHRITLAHVAHSTLLDGTLARRLMHAAGAENAGDPPPVEHAAASLQWLEQRETPPLRTIERGYRALVARAPHALEHRISLARTLAAQAQPQDARAVLQDWLDRNPASTPYQRALAALGIAELLAAHGQLEEALAAAQPALKWQTDRGLRLAALAHEAAGRREQADAAARALQARHPWSALGPLTGAELAWRRRQVREAAEILERSRRLVQAPGTMSALGRVFLEAFDASRDDEARAAFDALRERFHPFVLRELALAADRAGRHRLAFELASTLEAPGLGGLELSFSAYLALRQFEKGGAAAEWLRRRADPKIANRLAQVAHRRGAPEVLWSSAVDASGAYADRLWLMRAADSLLLQDAGRRAELRGIFAAPRADFYGTLTRHLLGLAAEEEVFALARTPHQHCTTAYFIGLKAETEGRWADASDWYRATVETGVIDTDGDPRKRDSLAWYQALREGGVLFSPSEFKWALARLPALRDRLFDEEKAGTR